MLKIYSHKTEIFKIIFLFFVPQYTYQTQDLHIIWKIEAVFQLFLSLHICCTILYSCGIAHSCIQ